MYFSLMYYCFFYLYCFFFFFFLMIRRPPRSTQSRSSAASDVYKRQGQKSRTGGFHKVGFEGGQMPMQRRLPKRGFKSHLLKFNAEITLAALERLDLAEVDLLTLKQSGLVGQLARNVKVIKSGTLSKAVKLNGISATAGAK